MLTFSIIIPTLNEEPSIVSCLAALQDWRDVCEIIVVDGGSADNTKSLAQPLVHKVIASEKGRALQMNCGATNALGDVLIFLHADTFLPTDALNQIAKAISKNRRWGRFDVFITGNHPMLKVVAVLMNCRSRLTGIATGDQVIFVERNMFNSVGRFPNIALMEDIALSKKLKSTSPPACLFTKVRTSGRRWEKFGVVKTILLMWNLRLRYFLGEDPNVLAELYQRGLFWKT